MADRFMRGMPIGV